MELQDRFSEFVQEKDLFSAHDHLLVAVSGGTDSMVLADLLHTLGYDFTVAHCNFALRGKESDEDEYFVKETTEKKYRRSFLSTRFDTRGYAAEHKLSIQEAARDLRYAWLEEERQKCGAACVVTAHHANDSVETLLLNLVRGTGLRGLTGIPVRRDKVVRPLLFAFREEIRRYAETRQVMWREDSSNASVHYQRNFIRHEILPRLRQLNPSADQSLAETISRLEQAERIYRQGIQRMRTELVHFDEALECFKISFLELASRNITGELMYEIVKDFGFNPTQAADMLEACFAQPGKLFYAPDSVAVADRMFILIRDRREDEAEREEISAEDIIQNRHPELAFNRLEGNAYGTDNPGDAWIDAALLEFPLEYRVWQPGDSFTPLGMKGRKKVSDFLVDAKVDRERKKQVKVLLSGGKIVWLAGFRTAQPFRVTARTKEMLHIRLQKL